MEATIKSGVSLRGHPFVTIREILGRISDGVRSLVSFLRH